MNKSSIPIIDLTQPDPLSSSMIAEACQEHGFFCVRNHGVSITVQQKMDFLCRSFFALPLDQKKLIHMRLGGEAWRGFFALGEELTSGKADLKEGVYFGEDLSDSDKRVKAKWPLHGKNLYPPIPEFKETIEAYISEITSLAHRLMRLVSLSLGLDAHFIFNNYTQDPTVLFRVFHYPPKVAQEEVWGVGAHTDYGLLTILKQDSCGGLEVKTHDGWIAVPPIENVFVCNIGDMLELLTKGHYRSTLHRVNNQSGKDRLSFPLFFDPSFDAVIKPLPMERDKRAEEEVARWDNENLHRFEGKYRDYLIGKISKVFPDLAKEKIK